MNICKDDKINKRSIKEYMLKWSNDADNTCFRRLSVLCLTSVTSTNDLAKERVKRAVCNTLTVAETQTAGRGRMDRTFHSPDKTGAYFTLTLRGDWACDDALKFTSLAAVAVCKAIEKLTPLFPAIKWVNDVYVDGKKVCGILCEATPNRRGKIKDIILGVGVNLTTEEFPDGVVNAGCLGYGVDRNEIIALICLEILKETPFITQNRHIQYYREHSLAIGKPVYYIENGVRRDGVATGVSDDYSLLLTLENGEMKKLSSGEITLRVKT